MGVETASVVYSIFMSIVMAALSALTYRRYARPDGSKATAVIVIFAWTTSLSIAFLLPIDLYPDAAAFVNATAIWSFLYWFCFVTTWLIFPIQQGCKYPPTLDPPSFICFQMKLQDILPFGPKCSIQCG
jgi:hypothetical protein